VPARRAERDVVRDRKLTRAVLGGDHDRRDRPVLGEHEIVDGTHLLTANEDVRAPERGERASPARVERELGPGEQDERRAHLDRVVPKTRGSERQEATLLVAASDLEPKGSTPVPVQHEVDRPPELNASEADRQPQQLLDRAPVHAWAIVPTRPAGNS
jgi:hypothetical protein